MDDKSENGVRYRLGRHWQTIQRSLFPEWEREMDMKFIEEEKRRRAEADAARKTGTVKRQTPSLYGGISDMSGRSLCAFMPMVYHII